MRIAVEKTPRQRVTDHLLAPLRLTVLSDEWCERLGATSINSERIAAALPHLRGHVLDLGCGRNLLLRNYSGTGIGVDVFDWGAGALILEDTSTLPFPPGTFDTVAILAALNHIPNREAVLREVHRVLQPDGQVVITMINPVLSLVGHRMLWWYGEDWERGMAKGEVYGFWTSQVTSMLRAAGFHLVRHERFLYRLNNLYVFRKAGAT